MSGTDTSYGFRPDSTAVAKASTRQAVVRLGAPTVRAISVSTPSQDFARRRSRQTQLEHFVPAGDRRMLRPAALFINAKAKQSTPEPEGGSTRVGR